MKNTIRLIGLVFFTHFAFLASAELSSTTSVTGAVATPAAVPPSKSEYCIKSCNDQIAQMKKQAYQSPTFGNSSTKSVFAAIDPAEATQTLTPTPTPGQVDPKLAQVLAQYGQYGNLMTDLLNQQGLLESLGTSQMAELGVAATPQSVSRGVNPSASPVLSEGAFFATCFRACSEATTSSDSDNSSNPLAAAALMSVIGGSNSSDTSESYNPYSAVEGCLEEFPSESGNSVTTRRYNPEDDD